jgi:drug/metabolite transporter (DMT)-like permease
MTALGGVFLLAEPTRPVTVFGIAATTLGVALSAGAFELVHRGKRGESQ